MSDIKSGLLDSALSCFTEKGYRDTSVQDIVDRCGVAKGTLYNFFDTKEDIFLAALERCQQGVKDSLDASGAGTFAPKERLEKVLDGLFEAADASIETVRSCPRRQELYEALEYLRCELKETEQKWFLVRSLTGLLEQEPVLSDVMKQIKRAAELLEKQTS